MDESGIEYRWSDYLETHVQVGLASGSVVSVEFTDDPDGEKREPGEGSDAIEAVFAYLDGEAETSLDVPYALTVSGVKRRALERTRDLPYGTMVTYEQFASSIGEDEVERVREAIHENPVPIALPSHRVVADTSVGGFAGPRGIKRRLLELEGSL